MSQEVTSQGKFNYHHMSRLKLQRRKSLSPYSKKRFHFLSFGPLTTPISHSYPYQHSTLSLSNRTPGYVSCSTGGGSSVSVGCHHTAISRASAVKFDPANDSHVLQPIEFSILIYSETQKRIKIICIVGREKWPW